MLALRACTCLETVDARAGEGDRLDDVFEVLTTGVVER